MRNHADLLGRFRSSHHTQAICSHFTEQLFVPKRKAMRCSINSNGTELEQVVHTHRASCRSSWPRGLGALNPSPHSWPFSSKDG